MVYHSTAKVNIGADGNYMEFAENSLYTGSSIEQEKDGSFHKNAKTWDYYVKTVKCDGVYFDVLINVMDTGNKQFVYDITMKEATSLPDAEIASYDDSLIAPDNSISETSEKVNSAVEQISSEDGTQFSLSVDSEGRTLCWTIGQKWCIIQRSCNSRGQQQNFRGSRPASFHSWPCR